MLNRRTLLFSGLALGATLLVGCGGRYHGSSGGGSTGGGTGGGSGAIDFSAPVGGYNGSSSSISRFTITQGGAANGILSAQGTLATIVGTSANTRIVDVVLPGNLAQGAQVTLSEDGTDTVAYSETTGSDNSLTKSWTQTGGTVTVQTLTASQLVLKLTGVTVTHGDSNDTQSVGGVTLNGTISVDLTAQE